MPGARGIGGRPTPDILLERNPQLAARVAALLPPGVDPIEASAGFSNLGQFIAATQVSHNLGIPFDDLRASLLDGNKVGDAIQQLRPDAEHRREARLAEREAKRELRAIERDLRRSQAPKQ